MPNKVIPAQMIREFKGGATLGTIAAKWGIAPADTIKLIRERMSEGEYRLFVHIHRMGAQKG